MRFLITYVFVFVFGYVVKDSTGSPLWLEKYIKFHNQEIRKPISEYGYLVFEASNRRSGVADKIRPVVEMFRLARSLNRVFIYTWLPFLDLTQYLEPNLINWNLTESISNMSRENFETTLEGQQNLTYDHIHNKMKIDPSIVIHITMLKSLTSVEVGHIIDDYSDIIKALFKPSAAIIEGVNEEYMTLKVNSNLPYVALHLRMLNDIHIINRSKVADDETLFSPTQKDLIDVINLLHCGEDYSSLFFTSLDNPIIIISDSEKMKRFIVENKSNITSNFVISSQRPTHILKAKTRSEMMSTFIDMFVMAQSTCLLGIHGRFSYQASKFGNSIFFDTLNACKKFQDVYQIPSHTSK